MPTVLIACSLVSRVSSIAQALTLTARRTVAKFAHGPRMDVLSYLDIECIGGPHADGGLVRRTSKGYERARRRVAKQPLVFDIGMNFPLRIDPIGHLRAGAIGVRSAFGVEDRQP